MTRKKGTFRKIILRIFGLVILFIAVIILNLIIVGKNQSIVSKGETIQNYGDNKPALLIIDIQEATTGEVSMYAYFREHSEELIRNINHIADSFNVLYYPVIYVRSEITNPLINLINSSYAKGHPGAGFDKRLKIGAGYEVVKKGKDSFRHTNLDSILIHMKVNELYIAGLDAVECVNATVEAARNRGYKVNLIEEMVISKSKQMKDSMMLVFRNKGVRVIKTDSLRIRN